MLGTIATLDWIIIFAYLALLIGFVCYLAKNQNDHTDYYVAGRKLSAWPIAVSVMATQCSTNSILGAPAFVAFAAGGGLIWLQYELALPLAMIVLILFVMPTFRKLRLISVYAYLEERFNRQTRLAIAGLFLFIRAFATAVTVYSISIVIDLITQIGFFWSVILLGAFTVVYDVIGGIKGVIYSDFLQMVILVFVLFLLAILLINDADGLSNLWHAVSDERKSTIDFSGHGWGDGKTFAFWPMLFGGLFLYLAYYGCDQSQVQRELCAKNLKETNKALLINGLLRFPIVALYCFVGLGIAVYAINHTDFITSLPLNGDQPNYNLAVPLYMIRALPEGVVGLGLVALFAAAMSSLDSVLNSLSATTMEDFVRPRLKQGSENHSLFISRLITISWGIITLIMAFFVDDIAPTVLEAINKIGSFANGPILALFAIGIFLPRIRGFSALAGMMMGLLCNCYVSLFHPDVSWLWWNVIGFISTVAAAAMVSSVYRLNRNLTKHSPVNEQIFQSEKHAIRYSVILFIWFIVLVAILCLNEFF